MDEVKMSNTASIISKVWNFCNVPRDDSVGYSDHLEQLTYLLFLKMTYEYILALEIVENPKAGLESFRAIAGAIAKV
jgi:type I restriction-modification system DNA methylase subunit